MWLYYIHIIILTALSVASNMDALICIVNGNNIFEKFVHVYYIILTTIFQISCSVTAFLKKDGPPSRRSDTSDDFFVGIKVR